MMNRFATLSILLAALLGSGLSYADGSASVTIQISVNLLPEANQEPQFQNCAVSAESTFCDTDLLQHQIVESNGQQLIRIVPI